jgi:CAAX prenyl protease-like protein
METDMNAASAPLDDPNAPKDAWIPHVVPFLAWIFLMQMLGEPAGWKYAVRSFVCLGLFLYLRPWRWYPRLNPRNILPAVGVGIFVYAFWIAFETDYFARFETLHRLYLTVGVQPPWEMAPVPDDVSYAPDVCGWPLTIIRLLGSAFVISFIEEFFWRGWMYRWMLRDNFLKADLGEMDWKMFVAVALMFGFIHDRWLVGFLCGLVYGGFVIRTRDVWAAGIAHAVTNFLLGGYIIWTQKWEFWP